MNIINISNMALSSCNDVEKLLNEIEENQIGYHHTIPGPFGSKRRKHVEIIIIIINIHSCLIIFSHIYRLYCIWSVSHIYIVSYDFVHIHHCIFIYYPNHATICSHGNEPIIN